MENKIIGISGISGAGKTTLARGLAESLGCTCIFWDEFDEISKGPKNYLEWYERGKNYAEWDYAALAKVLAALKKGQNIEHPAKKCMVRATKYIIFDAPLGKLHHQTGAFIDTCIHIETPLDILLGRRLIRDFQEREHSKEDLLEEMNFYLSHSRKLFFDTELIKTADIIVDGTLSTKEQIKTLRKLFS